MWWNERFSPTGSTLRSEPDCNVYNCPRSKSESAAFGSAIGTMEPLVSLPLMSIGKDSMMSSSGSLKFNQFNYSITPLGINFNQVTFSFLSQAVLLLPFRFLLRMMMQLITVGVLRVPWLPSNKSQDSLQDLARGGFLWLPASKPGVRLLFPLPTLRISCIRRIARTFK